MGRIKTKQTKRITFELIKLHKESFTKDFNENKSKLGDFAEIKSKKLRNTIAGYITRLTKREAFD